MVDTEEILDEFCEISDDFMAKTKAAIAGFRSQIRTSQKLAKEAEGFCNEITERLAVLENALGEQSKFRKNIEAILETESKLHEARDLLKDQREEISSSIREILDGTDALLRARLESLVYALRKARHEIDKDGEFQFALRVAILTAT